MGSATSKNIVKALNSVVVTAVMDVVQDNSVVISAVNRLDIRCKNSLFEGGSQTNNISVNTTAVQTAISSNEFKEALQNTVAQMAKAVNGALNPGKADSTNIAIAMNSIANTMLTNISQNCSFTGTLLNEIVCEVGADGNTVKSWKQSNILNEVTNCTQLGQSDNNLVADLTNALKQSASSTNEGLFGPLMLIIIIIIIGVIAFFLVNGKTVGDVLKTPYPWLSGFGVVGVLWFTKTGPFSFKIKPDGYTVCGLKKPDPTPNPDCTDTSVCNKPTKPSGAYLPCNCDGKSSIVAACNTKGNKTATVPCTSCTDSEDCLTGYTLEAKNLACGTTMSASNRQTTSKPRALSTLYL